MGLLEQKPISNIADFESAASTNLPASRQVPRHMGLLEQKPISNIADFESAASTNLPAGRFLATWAY
jgi:hypothetical protein